MKIKRGAHNKKRDALLVVDPILPSLYLSSRYVILVRNPLCASPTRTWPVIILLLCVRYTK